MSQEQEEPFTDWDVDELAILYNSSRFFTSNIKKKIGLTIQVPVYLQDPLVAERAKLAGDERVSTREEWELLDEISVPCELDLMRGPTSSRIAVVDYDADTAAGGAGGVGSQEAPILCEAQTGQNLPDQRTLRVHSSTRSAYGRLCQKILSMY